MKHEGAHHVEGASVGGAPEKDEKGNLTCAMIIDGKMLSGHENWPVGYGSWLGTSAGERRPKESSSGDWEALVDLDKIVIAAFPGAKRSLMQHPLRAMGGVSEWR